MKIESFVTGLNFSELLDILRKNEKQVGKNNLVYVENGQSKKYTLPNIFESLNHTTVNVATIDKCIVRVSMNKYGTWAITKVLVV